MADSIAAVGGVVVTLTHPLVNLGAATTLHGFRLDSTFLEGTQMMDNAKRVALVGGDTAALTNSVLAGDLTFHPIRIDTATTGGDIVSIAQSLLIAGDSVGGIIKVSYPFNGKTFNISFFGCIVKTCPPLRLAGNDIPELPVVFSYGSWALL